MKNKLLYASLFPLLPMISLIVVWTDKVEGPEQTIVGKWEETSWKYEKMDQGPQSESSWMKEIDDQIKAEISSHLVIHEAEIWEFLPVRRLQLYDSATLGRPKELAWSLKGRGNILELSGENGTMETYQIQELTKDKMILHFNSDLQVRGIVEMEFKRMTD